MHTTKALKDILSRRDIWRGYNKTTTRQVLPTGDPDLDKLLHGGWPKTALIELACHRQGIGELSLLLPILADYTQTNRLCVILNPPYQPHAPSWVNANIDLKNLIVVRSRLRSEWLWTAEHSIRSGALLLAWMGRYKIHYNDLRKLQLAAVDQQQSAFLFNRPANLTQSSPSPLRLEVDSPALHQLAIKLHKLNGAIAGSQVLIKSLLMDSHRMPLNQLSVPICYPVETKTNNYNPEARIAQTLNT